MPRPAAARVAARVAVCASALALLAVGPAAARADLLATVTPTVTRNAAGTYDYRFVVANAAASTVNVKVFDLSASAEANLTAVVNPGDFFPFYTTGFENVMFTAFDGPTGIAPGTSGTFAFTADAAPAAGGYQVAGYDDNNYFPLTGTVPTPTGTVPEPTALAAASAVALLARRRHVRRA